MRRRILFEFLSPAFASLAIAFFAAGGVMLLPAQALAQGGPEAGAFCFTCSGTCDGTAPPCGAPKTCGAGFYCSTCGCAPDRFGTACVCK